MRRGDLDEQLGEGGDAISTPFHWDRNFIIDPCGRWEGTQTDVGGYARFESKREGNLRREASDSWIGS